MPIVWGLANPKIGEREVTEALFRYDNHLIRTGQVIVADKGFSGRTVAGIYSRVASRLLTLAAGIWHNWLIGAPIKRSLIAYDH